MADNRHWLSLDFVNPSRCWLRLHDYDGRVSGNLKILGASRPKILGFIDRDAALIRITPTSYMAVDIGHGLKIRKTWSMSPPSDDCEVIPSPDGLRLLWCRFIADQSNSVIARFRRRYSDVYSDSYTLVIDVSNFDGNHMRELGREDSNGDEYANPHWMSDSKHITFTVNGKVWSIAVN